MNELLDLLYREGFDRVTAVIPDGKIHRFPLDVDDAKESGWYVAFENHQIKTGEAYYVMVYGSWRGDEKKTYCTLRGGISKEDHKAMKAKTDEVIRKADAHRRKVQEEVAEELERRAAIMPMVGESKYLRDKKIVDCPDLGVYFDENGDIYVPLRDVHGKLWTVQKIQADGAKYLYPCGRKTGSFHTLGVLGGEAPIFIAEGLATAATVRLATAATVVMAVDSGNLPGVASTLRQHYPDLTFVIAGDDDRWSTKPDGTPYNGGKEKAEEAAKLCLGAAVFPEFKELIEKQTTDFNDLHRVEGLAEVTRQLIGCKPEKMYVSALGFNDNNYFYTSSQNRQIMTISRFNEVDFLGLMPIEYWESIFPSGGASRVDWVSARSKMMNDGRACGLFKSNHVRGSGVWMDEGRVVVHMGDHLVVDGERAELGQFKSRYFYTLGCNLSTLHAKPLAVEECALLDEVCATLKWVKPDFAFLMAGALVVNRVCGALPIRPHVWLTGGAQTGKTTLLDKLIKPMLGLNRLYVQGGTTEAGIRQSLKANAIPLIFDEFETNGQKPSDNVDAVIEMLRSAWSDSDAQVVKGSSGGTAAYFTVRCCAIVSSIRTKLKNDADVGRFARLELAPHGDDEEHWKKLSGLLAQIDTEYSDRMFARTIKLMPVLLANYRTLKLALARRVSQRFGDQYGMLLAGYCLLLSDSSVTAQEADDLVEAVMLADESTEAKVADHDDALTHLLTKKISIEREGGRYDLAISEAIQHALTDVRVDEALQRYGIRVSSALGTVSIASKHAELEAQVFRNTQWSSGGWSNSLSRITGAKKNCNVRIATRQTRCVVVPMSAVL